MVSPLMDLIAFFDDAYFFLVLHLDAGVLLRQLRPRTFGQAKFALEGVKGVS